MRKGEEKKAADPVEGPAASLVEGREEGERMAFAALVCGKLS
jgi:hypothetical protein